MPQRHSEFHTGKGNMHQRLARLRLRAASPPKDALPCGGDSRFIACCARASDGQGYFQQTLRGATSNKDLSCIPGALISAFWPPVPAPTWKWTFTAFFRQVWPWPHPVYPLPFPRRRDCWIWWLIWKTPVRSIGVTDMMSSCSAALQAV